jgi:hypothetical protein
MHGTYLPAQPEKISEDAMIDYWADQEGAPSENVNHNGGDDGWTQGLTLLEILERRDFE